jgi:hypothetical protein
MYTGDTRIMQGGVVAQIPISQCISHTHEEAKGYFGQKWHSVLASTNQLRDKHYFQMHSEIFRTAVSSVVNLVFVSILGVSRLKVIR